MREEGELFAACSNIRATEFSGRLSAKSKPFNGYFLSRGRVALLGIAQRQISIKFSQKTREQNNAKPMPASIKTIGDLIQVKRQEKNLTPGHLAAKMGIATSLVLSWEDGDSQPDGQQMKVLVSLFGYDANFDPTK
jgi:DNA-binding transcriptional regulator YiaG